MVRLNLHGKGSGFEEGSMIHFDDDSTSTHTAANNAPPLKRSSSLSLLNPHQMSANPKRACDSEASIDSPTTLSYTSRKSSQPLELDLILENNTAVEGSSLNGYIIIKASKKASSFLVGPAKIRIIGFEAISYDRHTFYQHSAPLESASPSLNSIFCSSSNKDEFKQIKEGMHRIPFSFYLPRLLGAKGSVVSRSRVNVRYIALVYVLCIP